MKILKKQETNVLNLRKEIETFSDGIGDLKSFTPYFSSLAE